MSRGERTALIVGAGIGGPASALALKRLGWKVRVFERARSPRELGFALLLAPNAISALRRLGVADQVTEGGARFTGAEMRRADGRLLRSFDLSGIETLAPEPPVVVLRPVLHGALLGALEADELVLGANVTRFEQRDDSASLVLADGRRVEGDVIVGADGVGSVVRAALHPDEPPARTSGLFALRGVVHGVGSRTGRGTQYFGRGLEAAIAPAGDNAVYWYMSLTNEHLTRASREPSALARAIAADCDEGLRAIVRATAAEDVRLDELIIRDPLASWGTGRITLLGDAAHPMLPHAGQGAAQALEDAVTLGHVLGRDDDLEAALRHYERIRSARVRAVVATARRNARAASVRSGLGCWLRDLAIRLVPESVIAKSYVAFGTPPQLS